MKSQSEMHFINVKTEIQIVCIDIDMYVLKYQNPKLNFVIQVLTLKVLMAKERKC